jgi:acetyl-CoA carboxylase biotin carboxyl carrier protein
MDIKEIQHLIKFVAKTGVQEVKLEMENIKLTIKAGSAKAISLQSSISQNEDTPIIEQNVETTKVRAKKENQISSIDNDKNFITIKSPIIGTFYRKSSPDKPSFVEVGDSIKDGDVLCVIEAMKLFNEIESEITGKIIKILVNDLTPVEFDQPLFIIDPS